MRWYMVVVNGHPFAAYAHTVERAIETAVVQLASLRGASTIGATVEVCRWDTT